MRPLLSILALILLPTCYVAESPKATALENKPPAYRLVHSHTGKEMTLPEVADDLAAHDVVYFGELHETTTFRRCTIWTRTRTQPAAA